MVPIHDDKLKHKRKKLRIILWILFPILFAVSALLLNGVIGPAFLGVGVLILAIIDIVTIFILAEKFYNWPVITVLIFMAGMLFKRNHWPLAGALLTTGISVLCISSLVNAVRFQITLRNNPFLRWFGSISCIIIAVYMAGWLMMIQHWPRDVANILGNTGMVLFIISVLGMVFTLPGSKYLSWSMIEKKIFFRSILIPMGIVFCLILISVVFSDVFFWVVDRSGRPLEPFESIQLFDLEGINK